MTQNTYCNEIRLIVLNTSDMLRKNIDAMEFK